MPHHPKNKKIIALRFAFLFAFFLLSFITPALGQSQSLLSPEESFWLKSRNNTIVVMPEQNNPPYSYQSPGGGLQGLSIDYLELIAEKIGAKIEYLTPRSLSQILSDVQAGKGDVIVALTPDKEKEQYLIFTESYINVPVVIVVRKDAQKKTGLTLNDFNGKKVVMIEGSAVESYTATNYPRVVRERVTDDEVGLQQVVLGEVDGAVMDVASLSFYLSKQVLSSVKIAGNTGLDYKPAFALPKDRTILQSILEKGLSQISASDRSVFVDKWVSLPGETKETNSFATIILGNLSVATLYALIALGVLGVLVLLFRRKSFTTPYFRKIHNINQLREEVNELAGVNDMLSEELKEVKQEEEQLKEKLEVLNRK